MKLENHIDVKIFILYLLNRVGKPLEFTTINDIVIQDEFVGYFDFALCFSDLLEAGQIKEIKSNDKECYIIAETGQQILESYEGELLTIIKERAWKSASRLLDFRTVKAKIEETENGYILHCSIFDKDQLMLSVDYFSTDMTELKKMKENFEERAEIIYWGAISLLSGDVNFIFDD